MLEFRHQPAREPAPEPNHHPTVLTMEINDLVGAVAGILTTVSFVPQVIKTWRSRSARDISFGMFLLFSLGVMLWLYYGIAIHSTPIVVANGVTLLLSMSIILMKLGFDRNPR
jgi:MtN3 and saliva related transmembrane protein